MAAAATLLQLHEALHAAGMPSTAVSARTLVADLHDRLGLRGGGGDVTAQFCALLSLLSAQAPCLATAWVTDFLAFAASLSSADPDEAHVLQPQGACLAWCRSEQAALQRGVAAFLGSSGAAQRVDRVLQLDRSTQSLLAIAQAVQAAVGPADSDGMARLIAALSRLRQATQALLVLEQLQQQRPGSAAPLLSRSASAARLADADAAAAAGALAGQPAPPCCPSYATHAEWQQRVAALRARGRRLFLDDLVEQLLLASQAGARAPSYPWPDPCAAVEQLFLAADGGGGGAGEPEAAWHARLALLLYYLLDGGWLRDVGEFARGFQLPLTLAQQWQSLYLLDAAAAAAAAAAGGGGGAGTQQAAEHALDDACQLLSATACRDTPFRFVEALLAAGRPETALAVQRARCVGSSSGARVSSLSEAVVLARVQLGCGLLAEAFADMRRHCSQVPLAEQAHHVRALVAQLASWATEPSRAAGAAAGSAAARLSHLRLHSAGAATDGPVPGGVAGDAGGGCSRLQLLCELPLNQAEEAALLACFRERMAAGESGGHMLPLYLLQRGRSLEALAAYSEYQASPAGAAAAAAAAADDGAAEALLARQLHTLMAAAAAALPPALRAAAVASPGGDMRPLLAGLGGSAAAADRRGGGQALLLQPRGLEPPVFLAPLVPAGAGNGVDAAQLAVVGQQLSAEGSSAGDRDGGTNPLLAVAPPGVGAGASRAAAPAPRTPLASLFGAEVAAEAGPGAVPLSKPAPGPLGAAEPADFVPLLFNAAPAPAAAASSGGGGAPAEAGGATLASLLAGGDNGWGGAGDAGAPGLLLSEAEFEREVLGVKPAAPPARGGGGGAAGGEAAATTPSRSTRRSSKRARTTPVRFTPGGSGV